MKKLIQKTVSLLALLIIVSSCSSVRVASDYDKNTNFNDYKTFAFFKTGIDKAEISDLDKRRILRAIETELIAKGLTKSENPDLLVSIFTKERQEVNVWNNGWGGFGWGGFGWGGFGWGGFGWGNNLNNTSTTTQGSLYVDLIDAKNRELVWQGKGSGYLNTSSNIDKKIERIKKFVAEIMMEYPPGIDK